MAAVADRISPPGLQPRDVCLTVGLSLLFHGLLTVAILLVPRFQVGSYIRVPVSYTVNLVEAPPGGGGGPPAAPGEASAPAPVQTAPSPAERPAPALRPAPRSAPPDELTLPGRRPARKTAPTPAREREPSLRPPTTGQETPRPVAPVPAPPGPVAPAVPVPAAPPVVSAVPGASPGIASGAAVGKGSGAELAGTGKGAGGSSALSYYLTLIDRKIDDNWIRAMLAGAPEMVVEVRFRVLASGQVRDIELDKSSGNASVDASALRAIRQSIPLPPFPNLLTEPYLDLRYRFILERG